MKPSEIIREYGWVQNDLTGNPVPDMTLVQPEDCGGFCPMGAIMRSAYFMYPLKENLRDWSKFDEAIRQMEAKLDEAVRPDWPNFVIWNSRPDRTKEEVIDKLEEAGL